jgi:DNA (cytosine-5)-methyltransferase 1
MNKPYTVIELFAGAGGLALGLEQAGFIEVMTNDNDKWSIETLKKNRPNWNIVHEDIRVISNKGIKNFLNGISNVDLLSGGYPCQAFSYAGKKLGLNDVRGTLFYDYAKILGEIKPKMFIAENVRGLISHEKGRALEAMMNVFENEGYVVKHELLSATDYEVAQKRQRVFIVGVRNDIHNHIGEDFRYPEKIKRKLVLKDVLRNVSPSEHAEYSEIKKKVFKLVPQGGYWRDLPEDIAREYMGKSYFSGGGRTGMARRLSWDEPALTVLTSPSQKQTERIHPVELRPFTIRENARIQSFPDDWEFMGPLTAKYKQIGNAVPVNMAKHVAIAVKKYLDKITN